MIDTDHNQNSGDPSEAQEAMRQRMQILQRDLESAETQAQMPRYQCHKKVWALKISEVKNADEGIQPLDQEYSGTGQGFRGGIYTAVKTTILAILAALTVGCASTPKAVHHTAAITAPSVAPVKDSIASASQSSAETSRHISDIRRGTDTVDRKVIRALRFFP